MVFFLVVFNLSHLNLLFCKIDSVAYLCHLTIVLELALYYMYKKINYTLKPLNHLCFTHWFLIHAFSCSHFMYLPWPKYYSQYSWCFYNTLAQKCYIYYKSNALQYAVGKFLTNVSVFKKLASIFYKVAGAFVFPTVMCEVLIAPNYYSECCPFCPCGLAT